MGRQVEFVHTEEDTIRFLEVIEKSGGRIVLNGSAVMPTSIATCIVDLMTSYMCQFFVVCAKEGRCPYPAEDHNAFSGTAIEFLNCSKGAPLSRQYETGRLYIAPNYDGHYDADVLRLYNLLLDYIKRTYNYSKLSKLYVSVQFKEKYDINYYHAVRRGRMIRL